MTTPQARDTVSCPCGGWVGRNGDAGVVPAEVALFLIDHEGHCRCSGPAHDPHLHVTLTQVDAWA